MTEHVGYLQLLFSFDKHPPMSILCLFFLALMRLAPIISFAPFLGAKLPTTVKMGIVISFAAILLPHMMLTSSGPLAFNHAFIGYAFKELAIGFCVAYLVSIPFFIATSAGSLIDFMRGSSSLQVTDPFMQAQTSPIGVLYNYTLIALFYQIGGPIILLDALINSYQILPPDSIVNSAFFTVNTPLWKGLSSIVNRVLEVSIQMSAPSILAILMTELFLGVANRLAPQVQISFLGMSLKSLIGLTFFALGWLLIVEQLGKYVLVWLEEMSKFLTALQPFAQHTAQ